MVNKIDQENQALKVLESNVIEHHSRIEDESFWLFLATLGCWSVTVHFVQIAAYIITFALFGVRIGIRWKNESSFPERLKIIQMQVNNISDEGDGKDALRWRCSELGKRISFIRTPWHIPIFICIYLFFIASFLCCIGKFICN